MDSRCNRPDAPHKRYNDSLSGKDTGVVRVVQGLSLYGSERSRYESMNCCGVIARRRASRSTSHALKVGCTSRQQLAHWVQSTPAHTRRVAAKTRSSISSCLRWHLDFRKRRNLSFSSSFSSACRRIWTRSKAIFAFYFLLKSVFKIMNAGTATLIAGPNH